MSHQPRKCSPDSSQQRTSPCGCGPQGATRRTFLKAGTAAAAAAALPGRPIMAGPFEDSDYADVVPLDKRLSPEWVASLTERGEPTVYRGDALQMIGMPVGGICAGMVYLSGDGRLWLWEIFNREVEGILPERQQNITAPNGQRVRTRDGANYLNPQGPWSPFEQGFSLTVHADDGEQVRPLDASGFADVSFCGQWPIGTVAYRDDACPVTAKLEAFSPIAPLATDDSSLPATLMRFTLANPTDKAIDVSIAGRLENAVCLYSKRSVPGLRQNRVVRDGDLAAVVCTAGPLREKVESSRPDIVLDDFEREDYEGWTVEGTAFGDRPLRMADMPEYQGPIGGQGERVVNSHNTRQGEDVRAGDQHTGTLTSKPFQVERNFIVMLIGGGSHKGRTCVNLLVDGQVVDSLTGRDNNHMRQAGFNVKKYEGKKAQLQIVDNEGGGWGNIGVDQIVQSDRPPGGVPLHDLHDFGSMTLALLDGGEAVGRADLEQADGDQAERPLAEPLVGQLGRRVTLPPGGERTVTFAVTWHFPNLRVPHLRAATHGRHYATRFDSALHVARHLTEHLDRLVGQTLLWRDTWYDSTLPHWFLDRTFANTSTLATTTCHRLADGRFYAWEGIGCCPGTCTHVWHYAQAVGRVFPELERDTRERVDLGISFNADTGLIAYRGELHTHHADDGQAGTILRCYREHQMAADDAFLQRNWEKIRRAILFMIERDGNADGILEGAQPNTLDAAWFGKIAWLASLYLAALRAGEAMAEEMEDTEFARQCRAIRIKGAEEILKLHNGEYFIQTPDPEHLSAIGVDGGCYIDQVFGQSWAFQVGLGRLYSEEHIRGALAALWKYNFVPDVGPFREKFARGRWYAAPGDAGLVMATWPLGGKREDWHKHWQFMYFNECMSGFEWQVSAHMIWEGMITEGLAVARAIHDRYHGSLRNPYNEIECSDHYARAMASFGAYLAACGYSYHGPQGRLGFAPRVAGENFRCAFTAAEGWGTFQRQSRPERYTATLELKYGKLRLTTLSLDAAELAPSRIHLTIDDEFVPSTFDNPGDRVDVMLLEPIELEAGQTLKVTFT